MRRLFLGVVFVVLSTPGILLSQWDVKWHSTQSKDITGCEVVQSGHFDNSRVKSLIACLSEKTGDEIVIIDGMNGEIRWRSEQYYKIFKESVHVTDVDGDGKDEIVFAAQNTPKSTVALYLIAASGTTFAETSRPDPLTKQPPASSQKPAQAAPTSTLTAPAATAPAASNVSPGGPSGSAPPAAAPPVASDPPRTL